MSGRTTSFPRRVQTGRLADEQLQQATAELEVRRRRQPLYACGRVAAEVRSGEYLAQIDELVPVARQPGRSVSIILPSISSAQVGACVTVKNVSDDTAPIVIWPAASGIDIEGVSSVALAGARACLQLVAITPEHWAVIWGQVAATVPFDMATKPSNQTVVSGTDNVLTGLSLTLTPGPSGMILASCILGTVTDTLNSRMPLIRIDGGAWISLPYESGQFGVPAGGPWPFTGLSPEEHTVDFAMRIDGANTTVYGGGDDTELGYPLHSYSWAIGL